MDVPDSEKSRIHSEGAEYQEEFLGNIGDLIESVFDVSPYVEHTNNGLNLRVVPRSNVDEIVAVAEKFGLTTIERSKTNPESNQTWLRFKILTDERIEPFDVIED